MNYILTYLVFPLDSEKEVEVRCWLDGGHFPNFIDRVHGKIVIFNLSVRMIEKFVKQFDITSWECGQDTLPEEYEDLCKTVNNVIAENVSNYFRFSNRYSFPRPEEMSGQIFDLLSAAYLHDGYKAWRLRYYLSANCQGLNVKTFLQSKYSGDLTTPTAIARLRQSIQIELDEISDGLAINCDTESMPIADVWVDRNPYTGDIDRMYIGWFGNSSGETLYHDNHERFRKVTPLMNDCLVKLGIPRNTESSDVIKKYFKRAGYTEFKQKEWKLRSINPDIGIVSTVVVPYLEKEDPQKVIPMRTVPYAIDRDKHRILLFNLHQHPSDWLTKLKEKSLLRKAYFSYGPLSEYANLYAYMERRIELNIHGSKIKKQTLHDAYPSRGMCAYYVRIRCFSGLVNLDANNLPECQENIVEIILMYQEDYSKLLWAYKDLQNLQLIQRCNRVFYSDSEREYYNRNLADKLQRNYEELFDTYITSKYPEQAHLKKKIDPYYLAMVLGEEL